MQEFWRRWHISVSTWFKEYLYIPLGGNRKGKVRTALNKLAVFFCTGLWHGASLNFIIWGLINGGFMMLESYKLINTEKMPKVLRHCYAMAVTVLAFVFFRADTISDSLSFIGHMFIPNSANNAGMSMFLAQLTPAYLVMLVLAVIFSTPVVRTVENKLTAKKKAEAANVLGYAVSMVLFIVCILTMSSSSYNPFIYFRF